MVARLITASLICLVANGCRCNGSAVKSAPAAELVFEPSAFDPFSAYVGSNASARLTVTNRGGATADVDLTVDPSPFSLSAAHLHLVKGDAATVDLTFAPTQVGDTDAQLHVGSASIALRGTGKAIPECTATTVCATSAFDQTSTQCLETHKPDGTACQTSCVIDGQCLGGECHGAFTTCDDHDACTTDACSTTTGCAHEPRICPAPSDACHVAACDSASGCGFETVLDGTLCGVDDCLSAEVNICLAGQCVVRARPTTGRCSNRWLPATIPARTEFGLVYDRARHRTILFGGRSLDSFGDTWEWDGTRWLQRFPAASPSARIPYMFYDDDRQRVVVLGGPWSPDDHWEWDGTTWIQRVSVQGAPRGLPVYDDRRHRLMVPSVEVVETDAGYAGLLAVSESDGLTWQRQTNTIQIPDSVNAGIEAKAVFDSVRKRLVVIVTREPYAETPLPPPLTYEWDGTTWSDPRPSFTPAGRLRPTLAFDSDRARVELWGGTPWWPNLVGYNDTWEWDGSAWTLRAFSPAPPPPDVWSWSQQMVYDSVTKRLVLVGAATSNDDVYELTDTAWARRTHNPPAEFARSIAYDPVRHRTILFGGQSASTNQDLADTWEWDGAAWLEHQPLTSPPARSWSSLNWAGDTAVLFGGVTNGGPAMADAWSWDGTTWAATSTGPSARFRHAASYDSARNRVVLFGGYDTGPLGDTWELDGHTWIQAAPAHAPGARSGHALVYDAARARTVLFGGVWSDSDGGYVGFDDTWEWDGTDWTQASPANHPQSRLNLAMAYDSMRERVMLSGGLGNGAPNELWEWDGTTWTQRMPLDAPLPPSQWYRRPASMTYDTAKQRLVLVQGADTWLFVP